MRSCDSTELKTQILPPSPFQNRVCGCILGQSYQNNGYSDALPCLPTTVCRISGGEVVFREATLTSDRACIPAGGDGTLKLVADADFVTVLPTAQDQSAFAALLEARLLAVPNVASNTIFLTQLEAGSIVANLRVSNASTVPIIDDFAEGLALSVFFKGSSYIMRPVGACPPGEFSTNGQKPNCDPCESNFVVRDVLAVPCSRILMRLHACSRHQTPSPALLAPAARLAVLAMLCASQTQARLAAATKPVTRH